MGMRIRKVSLEESEFKKSICNKYCKYISKTDVPLKRHEIQTSTVHTQISSCHTPHQEQRDYE